MGEEAGRLMYPHDLAIDTIGNLYVSEFGNHRLQVFDVGGPPKAFFGQPGSGAGDVFKPWSVELARDDKVYFLDSGNHRVYLLDPSRF